MFDLGTVSYKLQIYGLNILILYPYLLAHQPTGMCRQPSPPTVHNTGPCLSWWCQFNAHVFMCKTFFESNRGSCAPVRVRVRVGVPRSIAMLALRS